MVPTVVGSLRWALEAVKLVVEPGQSGRVMGRRRRANYSGGRPYRHEVRVSPEEEAVLLGLAGEQQVTVPRLLVESALAQGRGETLTERRDALAKLFAVYRLLASVANNVNQIAHVANTNRQVPVDTGTVLEEVRKVAARVDAVIDELSLS